MNIRRLGALMMGLTFGVTGCGGGARILPPTAHGAPTGQQANVSVVIRVPSATAPSQRLRRPKFVSPSTASVVLALNGTQVGVIDTTPQSPQCVANGGSTGGSLCTGNFAIAAGTYSYALSAFDKTNGNGTRLASANGQFVVVPNQANVLHAVLNGVVQALSVSLNSSTVQQGVPSTVVVNVTAYDPDNNVIISDSYADSNGNPVSISLTDSDTSGATQLSQTTLSGAPSPITLAYNGAIIASQTIAATAPNVTGGAATLTVVEPSTEPSGSVGALVLTAVAAAGNASQWRLAASVVGTDGHPMAGVPISLAATGGSVAQSIVTSDAAGHAITTITPAGGASTAAVTASAGTHSATVNIIFAATTTTMHRRGVRDVTGPRLIFGFTRPGSNAALTNPLTFPDPCHVPPDSTPSGACQSLYTQQKLTLTPVDAANIACKAFQIALGVTEGCVGITTTVIACLATETGVGGFICIAEIDSGVAFVLDEECQAALADAVVTLLDAGVVYDSIQYQRNPNFKNAVALGCTLGIDTLNHVLSPVSSFSITSARTFTTDVAGFTPSLTVKGSGFNGFFEITLTRSGPSTAGPYTWSTLDSSLQHARSAGILVIGDTSMTVSPVVTEMGDPRGITTWTLTAIAENGASYSDTFTVDYEPTATTSPDVPGSTSPGTTSGPGPTEPANSVDISWSAAPRATTYDLGVRDMVTNTLVVDKTVTSTNYTANLAAGGRYRWSVRACNSAGCSPFTTELYFQTPAASIPNVPTGTSPGTTTAPGPVQGANTVALGWSTVPGATYYNFGVRDMSSGTLVVSTTTTSTTYAASLAANTPYRWNVQACNDAGCSAFSAQLYFQTPAGATTPPTPTGTSPGSTTSPGPTQSSSTVSLSWNASSGAAYYSLGVRDMASGSLVVNTTTTATSYSAALASGGQFRWNVAACNSAGTCSPFTTELYFQTPSGGGTSLPVTPTGTSPGTTSSPGPTQPSTTVTLSWNPSSSATYYSVGVRDMSTNTLVVNTTTTATSYSASLTSGKQFRWNVAACNSAGCSSFTTDLYFQTPTTITIPAMPTNTSPGATSSPGPTQSSSTVTLSWNASSGATYYSLGVRDMTTNALVVNTTTSGTSYSASLTSAGRFRWNVAACNSAGCSSFTTDLYFQTPGSVSAPASPTATGPGNVSSPGPTQPSSTVTLSWGSVSGATYYSVGVRDMTSGTLVVDTTTTSLSYTASLSGKGKFRWNVAACNSAGCSSFTTPLYFQTP
jgi:uncharacterized protein YegP (UPF0339 family)